MNKKIVVDTGKEWMAAILIEGTHASLNDSAVLHLFQNDYEIVEASILSDLVECTYGGYAYVILDSVVHTGIDTSDRDSWYWPTAQFTATSGSGLPQYAYGAYVTDYDITTLLWAETFDTAFEFAVEGDGFFFAPTLSLGSIY